MLQPIVVNTSRPASNCLFMMRLSGENSSLSISHSDFPDRIDERRRAKVHASVLLNRAELLVRGDHCLLETGVHELFFSGGFDCLKTLLNAELLPGKSFDSSHDLLVGSLL